MSEIAQQVYRKHTKSLERVATFVAELKGSAAKAGGVFDAVAAQDYVVDSVRRESGSPVPEKLAVVMEELQVANPIASRIVLDSLGKAIAGYEREHGVQVPPDLINQAIHNLYAASGEARKRYKGNPILDSANSLHMDNNSLQPNRAVVSLLSIFSEAIPFAHYLPADIGSNEAKLAILSHETGAVAYGEYGINANLDGINSGRRYISSKRSHRGSISVAVGHEGEVSGALTTVQSAVDACDPAADPIKLIRGRSQIYVNGLLAGGEVSASGSGNSVVSGSAAVAGTTYTISGNINTDTGVFLLTTSPAIPNTNTVIVEGFRDYEREAGSERPQIISNVEVFPLFALPWEANTQIAMGASTQMQQELGLDGYSEGMMTINLQYANERHYDALTMARRIAANRQYTFDFDYPNRKVQLVRSMMWLDFAYQLGVASQVMANETINHGITHLYVGKEVLSQWQALPGDLWQPSGIVERPGIYRAGTLFGKYAVYYDPRATEALVSSHMSSTVLCIGRATEVARNFIVMGDAVPPTMVPLSVGTDLKRGTGFYARGFTNQNPHPPSQMGCAQILITNLT